jgi:tripartite-type tricarboxylate transporter receptor subunit TctC
MHVPYKGGAGQTQALIGGEVVYGFSSMPPAISQVKGGNIFGLAVTSAKRVSTAPDVPTLKELGVPLEILLYSGLLGPKGLPPAVVERLGAEVAKALASPEIKRTLLDAGADPITSTPAEFATLMKAEAAAMAKAVQPPASCWTEGAFAPDGQRRPPARLRTSPARRPSAVPSACCR